MGRYRKKPVIIEAVRFDGNEEATAAAIGTIGAAIDGASDAPILAEPGDVHALGGEGGRGEDEAPMFPPDCPISCLGINGQTCYYLDWNGQPIALGMGNQHGKLALIGLFGPAYGWLEAYFTQWSKPRRERDDNGQWVVVEPAVPIGFDQARAAKALIVECTRKGIFNLAGRLRGSGAHRGWQGGLILHCGNHVMRRPVTLRQGPIELEWFRTGLLPARDEADEDAGFVYSAGEPVPRPWPEAVGEQMGERALALLKSWTWRRPQLDPLLVLGGIVTSPIGGALEWRGNIWITGGSGTGKSTLNGKHGLFAAMFGRGQVRSTNVSEAYLRQRMRNSTLPIFLDELEAQKDGRRNEGILELARISSSGDDGGRGGQDHNAVEFTLQSSFWASSILIPAMEPQDRSRWAFCQLMPIAAGARKPDVKASRPSGADWGRAKAIAPADLHRMLMRRMVDGWWRWDATLEAYREALSALGLSARACDQFGTLLAGADLALYDQMPDAETIEAVCALCRGVLREVSDNAPEHERCVGHLLTSMVQARGGDERESVATWVGRAVQEIARPHDPELDGTDGPPRSNAHRKLQELGLKLVQRSASGAAIWAPGERAYLAVANDHQALAALFEKTKWAGGVWAQALGYTPDAVDQGVKVKFHKRSLTATLIPLEAAIDPGEVPAGARWEGLSTPAGEEGGEG